VSFTAKIVDAWRTRDVVTYGPRLSDDPRYAAMRRGQERELAAENEWSSVTYTVIRERSAEVQLARPVLGELAEVFT
jgi:hypothetical protein